MKTSLVDYLRCPATGGPLQLSRAVPLDASEITSGWVRRAAGRACPVADEVPVMLWPEAFAPANRRPRRAFRSAKWRAWR